MNPVGAALPGTPGSEECEESAVVGAGADDGCSSNPWQGPAKGRTNS